MANLSSDELKKIKAQLLDQANLQKKLNEGAGAYAEIIADIKNLHTDISKLKSNITKQDVIAKAATDAYNKALKSNIILTKAQFKVLKDAKDLENTKLSILKDSLEQIEKQTAMLVKQAKEATTLRNVFGSIKSDLITITRSVTRGYSSFKKWSGTFEIDKSIRMSATQMGILSKQTDGFRDSLDRAGQQTASFGVGISELAKMQADYSEELGRTVMLGDKGLEAMAEMAKATGLGAEGAARMASDMENLGFSAERTAEFINQVLNDSTKLGLNGAKVVKNMQANMKLLNKYNFKGGVKGFAKMAETVTKLGISMDSVAGMADKLFDIEGAVDMSAQLQVLGGAWAKLADPFHLMFMARNDMEGLTKEIGQAAAASVHFNNETKDFEISSLEMHRLRKIAEQTGIAYEDLAKAGKNAAKFTRIRNQMSFSVDKETKDFLETTSKFNDKGEAYIEIKGEPRLLKSLTSANVAWLKAGIDEKETLKKRAEASQTFDEKMTNIVMQFKQFFLPFVNALDKGLRPVLEGMTKTLQNPKIIESIKLAAEVAGKTFGLIGKFIATNPATALVTALTGFGLFEAGKWYLNGKMLGFGFNSIAKAGGGSANAINGGSGMTGKLANNIGKLAIAANVLSMGIDAFSINEKNNKEGKSGWDSTKEFVDKHKTALILAGLVAATAASGGLAAGATIPLMGAAVTAGSIADPMMGTIGKYDETAPIKDGIVGGTKGNRGIVQGGKITPIDNKDSLMAYKPNGPIDKQLKNTNDKSNSMKIEFGEIHFKFDELRVTSPGNPGISIELLKDQSFIRSITRMVHSETEKVINGGKNKG